MTDHTTQPATDDQDGDVVIDADGECWQYAADWDHRPAWLSFDGAYMRDRPDGPVTLLVRNGQPVVARVRRETAEQKDTEFARWLSSDEVRDVLAVAICPGDICPGDYCEAHSDCEEDAAVGQTALIGAFYRDAARIAREAGNG